jgi:chemotaxis protein CheD
MNALTKIFVMTGQQVVTESPMELITILGSCVSVCLWDRKTKTGGMNHYLLPSSHDATNDGVVATRLLIKSMIDKMSSIKNLEAKIFGGGNRFFCNNFLVVGPRNVEAAKKVLAECGIPIVLHDTGGETGRKIHFNTQTGNVVVKAII